MMCRSLDVLLHAAKGGNGIAACHITEQQLQKRHPRPMPHASNVIFSASSRMDWNRTDDR